MSNPAINPTASSSIPRKTNVAVIREEYVSITGKFEPALILNQLIYWTQRVYDFDKFNIEENKRKDDHGLQEQMEELYHGWIYKTATQLSKELMTGWSDNTTRKYIKILIQKGFIEERQNPKYKWNQTKQYRVNLNAVETALAKMGYSLPGYTVTKAQTQPVNPPIAKFEIHNGKSEIQAVNTEIVPLKETILKTTTTEPPNSEPVPEPSPLPGKKPSSSVLKNDDLTALTQALPEIHRTESVIARIRRALTKGGHSTDYVLEAIGYTVNQSPDKFLGYLGTCIDGNFHAGHFADEAQRKAQGRENAQERAERLAKAQVAAEKTNADRQRQMAVETEKRRAEQETLRELNQRTDELMASVDIPALDNFITNQSLNAFEMKRFNSGKRDLTRRRFVDEFSRCYS